MNSRNLTPYGLTSSDRVDRFGAGDGYSSGTAALYDQAVGLDWFRRAVVRFSRLVRTHQVSFRDAADIGCGTGLFACYLNRSWGVPVFAVDLSRDMLAEARRRCACLPGITLLHQDVRRLMLPRQVDLITAHFDTLNHLTGRGDLMRAMRSVVANLAPGGWFYFDLVTPCAPLGGYDVVLRRVLTRRTGKPARLFEQRAIWLPRRRLIAVRARVAQAGPCGVAVGEDRHFERAYGVVELGDAIAAAGLIVRGVYDEATLRAADRCPPRLVVVAQKPA